MAVYIFPQHACSGYGTGLENPLQNECSNTLIDIFTRYCDVSDEIRETRTAANISA